MKLRAVTGVGSTFHSNGAQKSVCPFFPWVIHGDAAANVTLGTSHILWGQLWQRSSWLQNLMEKRLFLAHDFVDLHLSQRIRHGKKRWAVEAGLCWGSGYSCGSWPGIRGHATVLGTHHQWLPPAGLHSLLKYYCQLGTSTHNTSLQGTVQI